MTGLSSYSVRKETLPPTMAMIAWIIASTAEKSMAYAKLEYILFLADWKFVQTSGRTFTDIAWQHDNQTVVAVGLFKNLVDDNHFLLTDTTTPARARVALSRLSELSLPADLVSAVGTHIKFLDGQSPSSLRKMCAETFPFRSTRAKNRFQLDERFLAYKQSRRAETA